MTYGKIAASAGAPRAARQVARFLHSSSKKYRLPWHRVVNTQGRIALPEPGYSHQLRKLKSEGVALSPNHRIDLSRYAWTPETN